MELADKFKFWIKENFIYILIFFIAFSLRVCAINNKTTFFFDDPATFNVSTPNNRLEINEKIKYSWADLNFKSGENYSAVTIKKALFESKPQIKEIYKDLMTMRRESLDRQHTNLYYSIIRIWTAGMDYSNPKAMMIRGCSLNLIFFMLSFFFMYKLLNLIKKDKKFVALGLFFAFIITGSISCTLLIRDYPLTEAFFTFALYVFLVLYNSVGQNVNFSYKKIFLYAAGLSVLLLSNYHCLILFVFLFFIILYKCFKERDKEAFKRTFLIFGYAFLFTLIFCPMYAENFRYMEHMGKTQYFASFWNFMNFYQYGLYMLEILIKFVFYNIVLFLAFYVLSIFGLPIFGKNKLEKGEINNFLLIFSITFSFAYLICVIAPFHEYPASRYIIFCLPVISISLAVLAYYLRQACVTLIVVMMLVSSAIPVCLNINPKYLEIKNIGKISFFKDFSHLDIREYVYDFKTNQKRPVVLVNRNWIWPNYVIYLDNDTIFRFEDKIPEKDYIFDNYVLIDREDVKIIEEKN